MFFSSLSISFFCVLPFARPRKENFQLKLWKTNDKVHLVLTLFEFCRVLVVTMHQQTKDWMHLVEDGNHEKLKCGVLAKGPSRRLKYLRISELLKLWISRGDEIFSVFEFLTWNHHLHATFNAWHYFGGRFYQGENSNFPQKPSWSGCLPQGISLLHDDFGEGRAAETLFLRESCCRSNHFG